MKKKIIHHQIIMRSMGETDSFMGCHWIYNHSNQGVSKSCKSLIKPCILLDFDTSTGRRPNLAKYQISPMRTFRLSIMIFLRLNFLKRKYVILKYFRQMTSQKYRALPSKRVQWQDLVLGEIRSATSRVEWPYIQWQPIEQSYNLTICSDSSSVRPVETEIGRKKWQF